MTVPAAQELGTVGVVGLGLMGGSLARDLAALGVTVLGADADARTLEAATAEGVIARSIGADLGGLADADVVVIALPVLAACEALTRAAPHLANARLVTDVGSTKGSLQAAAERAGLSERFVGSHPMAGDHTFGWAAARSGLFRDARVFLAPTAGSTPAAIALAEHLWHGVGGRTEVVDAEAHDRMLAATSHLPQIASSAFARVLSRVAVPASELGPGGRDVSRLSKSSPEMWTSIALDNAPRLLPLLEALEAEVRGLREALAAGDRAAVHDFFAVGRGWAHADAPTHGSR